jgi:23S rRNA (pseudouridine1915-N3)-methyltransferase
MLLSMELTLANIGTRPGSKDGFDVLTRVYLERCSVFAHCQAETFRHEEALFAGLARRKGRTQTVLVLLDSRGRSMTSEAFAAWLGARRDDGAQHIVFAIGPADGWSEAARQRANLLLSLGHDACPLAGATCARGADIPRSHNPVRSSLSRGTLMVLQMTGYRLQMTDCYMTGRAHRAVSFDLSPVICNLWSTRNRILRAV